MRHRLGQQPLVVVDFETYYDGQCSLTVLSPLEYIHHPKFKVFGVAVVERGRAFWLTGDAIQIACDRWREEGAAICAHNASFDAVVLAYIYNFAPSLVYDTMHMARAAGLPRLSLDAVGQELGLGGKEGAGVLPKMRGVVEPSAEQMEELERYAVRDAALCAAVCERLMPLVHVDELRLIDWTVRLALRRTLRLDRARVAQAIEQITRLQESAVSATGASPETLRSTNGFAELVAAEGYDMEWKPGKRGPIPALAKTDPWMRAALGSDDPKLRQLALGRRAAKSTMALGRARRFLALAEACSEFGAMLTYWGAHTGRWAGAGKLNLQNLPRSSDEFGGVLRSLLEPSAIRPEELKYSDGRV